jgi:8-oxo-dGTP diphosphatase
VAELIHADAADVRAAAAGLSPRFTAAISELSAGTLITLEFRRTWWDRRPRRLVLRSLRAALEQVERRTARTTIVAAALFRDHRVLAARRSHPASMAGKWEFPGGKVERGETPSAALRRECAEELGVSVAVGAEIGRELLASGAVLLLLEARLLPGSPDPAALEHSELKWLSRDDVPNLEWLDTNRRFVAEVTGRL